MAMELWEFFEEGRLTLHQEKPSAVRKLYVGRGPILHRGGASGEATDRDAALCNEGRGVADGGGVSAD